MGTTKRVPPGCDRSAAIPVFRVIDIKATRAATAFHKAQVAFYSRMLESVLSEIERPCVRGGFVSGYGFQPYRQERF